MYVCLGKKEDNLSLCRNEQALGSITVDSVAPVWLWVVGGRFKYSRKMPRTMQGWELRQLGTFISVGFLDHNDFCGNFKNKIWNLLLYFQTGVKSQQKNSAQQQVKQSVTEGGISILNCDCDNTMLHYFQWYRKYPAKNPTFLISISSILEKNEDGRFTVLHNRSAKHLSLHISASQPGDSALYLCEAGTRWSPGTWSLYANVLWGLRLRGTQTCFPLCMAAWEAVP